MVYVIVSNKHWHETMPARLAEATGQTFHYINKKNDLTVQNLRRIQPRFVFFPHWSYLVPKEVYDSFECVIFHLTDVPFGRGGSPLQNLISRKIYNTKITALRCSSEVDAGDVYLKKPFTLHGGAEEIYLRAGLVIEKMIIDIVCEGVKPTPQVGDVVQFSRRKPEDGCIAPLTDLVQLFDYIRMLDADSYPKAFLETEHFRLEFQRPSLKFGKVIADVVFTQKG